jgi:hypothetical protein
MGSQDHSVGQGDDRAYLRNVAFVPKAKATAPKPAAPKAAASVEDARARRRAHRARSVFKSKHSKRSKSWEKRSEGDAVLRRGRALTFRISVSVLSGVAQEAAPWPAQGHLSGLRFPPPHLSSPIRRLRCPLPPSHFHGLADACGSQRRCALTPLHVSCRLAIHPSYHHHTKVSPQSKKVFACDPPDRVKARSRIYREPLCTLSQEGWLWVSPPPFDSRAAQFVRLYQM